MKSKSFLIAELENSQPLMKPRKREEIYLLYWETMISRLKNEQSKILRTS